MVGASFFGDGEFLLINISHNDRASDAAYITNVLISDDLWANAFNRIRDLTQEWCC